MLSRFAWALLTVSLCTAVQASSYSDFNAGIAAYRRADWDSVISNMTAALAAPDFNPSFRAAAHFDRAYAYDAENKLDSAVADLTAAIAADGGYLQAYTLRGKIFRRQKKFALAEADLSHVVDMRPRWKDAYIDRMVAHDQQKDRDSAIADLTHALELSPNDGYFLGARGSEYRLEGKFSEAIADYDAALKSVPNDPTLFTGRGVTHESMGDFFHAREDFEAALRVDPERFTARLGLGFSQWGLGEFAESRKTFGQIRAQHIPPALFVDLMIWVNAVKGGDSLPAEVKADSVSTSAHTWPFPIVNLLLGTGTVEEVAKAAAVGDAPTVQNSTCEMDFYVGVWRETQKDKAGAIQLLSAAAHDCSVAAFEGPAAAAEMNRLK